MSQYTKYKLYIKQQRISGSSDAWVNCVPTVYSYNGDGTMTPVIVESASTDCGFEPVVEPIYKWENMDIRTDYICDECETQYRWVVMSGANDYWCLGTTKYTKEKKQVSYDSGSTWEDVVPLETRSGSTVIEYNSIDCGYVPPVPPTTNQYLTFVALEEGTFQFNGNSVYYSLDNGTTWLSLYSSATSPFVQSGQTIMWKAELTPNSSNGIGTFSSSGNYNVEGNPMSLLYGDNFSGQTSLEGYAFLQLFSGSTKLISAENLSLPATTLASRCYSNMFYGCTSLTSAPVLPATTLAQSCYSRMFYGCTSLTVAPQLPATTLVDYCYSSMFSGCNSLTTAPVLSATTLAYDCCESMFEGCTSLTSVPSVLPATTLAQDCYSRMFYGCTSLTVAPQLPATTLAAQCYNSMFRGCTSLTTAPVLSATTLAYNCYAWMFYGCTNLSSITCLATSISAPYCLNNWVNGVASSGTFTKAANMSSWTIGVNGIPSGWTVVDYVPPTPPMPSGYSEQYLTFVALESGTFKLTNNSVSYSLDSGATWTTLANYTNSPTVNVGDKIMWKGELRISETYGIGTFSSTGNYDVEGNPMSLLYGDNFIGQTDLTGKDYAFKYLFRGSTKLISAENLSLPATTLVDYCYLRMFYGCTSLTTAPSVLSATTLATSAYTAMFSGCTSLTTAPELPSTTLVYGCYSHMFDGCTSLTSAPVLPATTLDTECYYGMFYGCTSLTSAPQLPATTLANYCYSEMFYGCTSLTTAPSILPATTLAKGCYYYMFRNCTSLTTAPELPATTLADNCYRAMFYDCTSLNSITCLATNISATNCTTNWVSGVQTTSGTFTKAASMTRWGRGNSGIPNNWTVVDYS